MPRGRTRVWLAAVLVGAGLVFSANAFAHNIDLKGAREKAREYARSVRKDSGGKYRHYATDCANAFPNHNHYVRCTIFFQSAEDKARDQWTCTEKIEVYHKAHGRTGPLGIYERFGSDTLHIKHTSQNRC